MADLPDYYTQAQLAFSEVTSIRGGLDANKSASPAARDIYLATDTGILYVCLTDGTWTNIGILYLLLAGGTMTGAIAMGANKITGLANPTAAQDAATRVYVLAQKALCLLLTGGVMAGEIWMNSNRLRGLPAPVGDNDAARKKYVDDLVALYLLLTGGTLTGNLLIIDNKYIQLGDTDREIIIRAWDEVNIGGVNLQPLAGNRICFLALKPKGTSEQSQISLYNVDIALGEGNYSVFSMKVVGDTVHFVYEDAGSPPTSINKVQLWNDWYTNDLIPNVDDFQKLGSSILRYEAVHAYHHEFLKVLPSDHSWSGITAPMTAGTALTRTQAVYVGGDGKMEKALATGAATMPAIALATGTIAENAEGDFLMQGFFRDDTWNWTIGGLLYISKDTAGALTQTLPAASGEQVQVVGVAITADIIHFNPSYELVEIS